MLAAKNAKKRRKNNSSNYKIVDNGHEIADKLVKILASMKISKLVMRNVDI